MSEMEQETCRSCGKQIIWAVHERTLKEAPINAEPSDDGNVVLTERDAMLPTYVVLGPAKRFGRTGLRKSHFADCPQAPKWRRK